MDVKLVSLTQSCITEEMLSPEELIVYIARVSNPSNQLNKGTAPKLLRFLVDNKHWSPFEMVDMTVGIETSRGIAQQILRHRSFSFQEFSQRYSKATAFEPVELRKTGATNRQSSLEVFNPTIPTKDGSFHSASKLIDMHLKNTNELYNNLIDAGVAKECARFVLPITTQTKIYMKGSIRSWIHYLQIRCDNHTQLEHRLIADEIREIFRANFPNISEALEL